MNRSLLFEYTAEKILNECDIFIKWKNKQHRRSCFECSNLYSILPATESSAANKAREITKHIVRGFG